MTPKEESLRGLVEKLRDKWRFFGESETYRRRLDPDYVTANVYKECSEELEAALAAAPPPALQEPLEKESTYSKDEHSE